MQILINPVNKQYFKCLVLVGGVGDTPENFAPLVTNLLTRIKDTAICTFNFSDHTDSESLLDLQSRELEEVFNELTSKYNFKEINIFTTSMGAYPTTYILSNNKYSDIIKHVIFYDPADYYISAKFAGSNDSTWSGPDLYRPNKEVVSNRLKLINSQAKISVVHLTLRNYSKSGYIDNDYADRGIDHEGGYPRLNKQMVKHFYHCIPVNNRGEYIKEPNVPHGGIVRDGNIQTNIDTVATTIATLLNQ